MNTINNLPLSDATGICRRLVTILLLTTAMIAAGVQSAWATPGALSQPAGINGCISEDGTGGQCVVGHGLSGSAAVAISPDGRNVYVVSTFGQSIASFARDAGSGALTETGCFGAQPPTIADPCTQIAAGLSAPTAVTVSGDGRSVYVTSRTGELSVFARDPATGALAAPGGHECIFSTSGNCPTGGVALQGASGVVVSPDAAGGNVYVASANDQAIAGFTRNRTTSLLTQPPGQAACLSHNGTATSATGTAANCTVAPDDFVQPLALAISSDGLDLFATDKASHALWDLGRNPATGGLTTPACYGATGCQTVHGLNDARDVAVTPDGRAVIVVSATPGSIAVLHRSPGNTLSQPLLSPAPGMLYDCFTNNGADGCVQGRALAGASAVATSPDGTDVYVSAVDSGAIATFTLDPATDRLAQLPGTEGCLSYNGSGGLCTAGRLLEGISSIVASPDGRNLYGVSLNHSAVLVIDREQVAAPSSGAGSGESSPPAAAGGSTSSTPGGGARGNAAVTVSHFAITIHRGRSHRPARGVLRFVLSDAAQVRLSVSRLTRGHRAHGRCAPGVGRSARARSCSYRVYAGSLSRFAEAGRTTLAVVGHIGTAKLPTGTYAVTLVAIGPGGLASRPQTRTFTTRAHRGSGH